MVLGSLRSDSLSSRIGIFAAVLALYRIFLWSYRTALQLAALRSPKARQWVAGRRGQTERLRTWRAGAPGRLLWMHCASLGEFEQGRPVLEAWRAAHPDWRLLLTFFSPSGYAVRKNYPGADYVAYLPLDGPRRAAEFLDAIQPDLAVFVKYEFWYFYLTQLKERGVPTFLIAATFRARQPFFRWYGSLHRRMLRCFTHLYVQDDRSRSLLADFSLPLTVAGDTRIDRVLELAEQAPARPEIERFINGQPVLVAGSTWRPDLAILREWSVDPRYADWKLIVAPHDVSGFRPVKGTINFHPVAKWDFQTPLAYYSQLPGRIDERILVIDNVGMLASLYRYATIVYIGGGFGAGIHNTLEPMAFGKPVLFGSKYEKFPEAVYLDGFPATGKVVNGADFKRKFDYLIEDEIVYQQACERAYAYLQAHAGATQLVISGLENHLAS